jgi:hypothetical protein
VQYLSSVFSVHHDLSVRKNKKNTGKMVDKYRKKDGTLPVLRALLHLFFGASKRLPASKFEQKRRYYSISGVHFER